MREKESDPLEDDGIGDDKDNEGYVATNQPRDPQSREGFNASQDDR